VASLGDGVSGTDPIVAAEPASPTVSVDAISESAIPFDLVEILPVAGVVGAASLGAVVIARGACSPSAPVMFTNVRLLPCIASSTIERTAVATIDAVSKLGSSGGASIRSAPRVAGAIIDPFRDGFDRAVRGSVLADEDTESLRDGRLLAQIGIVLGTIYAAFLTVWFWATRVRWSARA
jgi:hypothetical protein